MVAASLFQKIRKLQPCGPRANHEILHILPPGANTCVVVSAQSIPVYSRSCFQFVKSASKIRHCVRARNPSTSAATSNSALQRKLQSFYKLPTIPPGLICIVKVERKSSDQARFGISEE
jgi:hypothetical protein